jgi:DNA polymerase III epsilon subunit-like protein
MGTYLDNDKWVKSYNNAFVFDLEYVGTSTTLTDCHIWDIGIVHVVTGNTFEVSIIPDISPLPVPFSEEFIQLTSEYLTSRQAISFQEAWKKLLAFVARFCKTNVIWIAHNAFKADKSMLEIDTKRHGIKMPMNWFFFDSLIFARQKLPKQPSYTLRDLHILLLQRPIVNIHTALPDAIGLYQVLIQLGIHGLNGPMYTAYNTPLQAVKWLGPSCERAILNSGVRSVEHLIIMVTNAYSDASFTSHVHLSTFVRDYISHKFQIKQGNAASISLSLITKWIPGV